MEQPRPVVAEQVPLETKGEKIPGPHEEEPVMMEVDEEETKQEERTAAEPESEWVTLDDIAPHEEPPHVFKYPNAVVAFVKDAPLGVEELSKELEGLGMATQVLDRCDDIEEVLRSRKGRGVLLVKDHSPSVQACETLERLAPSMYLSFERVDERGVGPSLPAQAWFREHDGARTLILQHDSKPYDSVRLASFALRNPQLDIIQAS